VPVLNPRRNHPFIPVNGAARPASRVDCELFGQEDASPKQGRFEPADGGTLFLNEIDGLPLTAPIRLLHALRDQRIEREDGTSPVPVNVRVIAATHQDLAGRVRAGPFGYLAG